MCVSKRHFFFLEKIITNRKFRIRENMWWARTSTSTRAPFLSRSSTASSNLEFEFRNIVSCSRDPTINFETTNPNCFYSQKQSDWLKNSWKVRIHSYRIVHLFDFFKKKGLLRAQYLVKRNLKENSYFLLCLFFPNENFLYA